MKYALGILIFIILVAAGGYWWWSGSRQTATPDPQEQPEEQVIPDPSEQPQATTTATESTDEESINDTETLLGKSAGGNDVRAYHYGDGAQELLFVGGIHGGYSWNTALVAYELMDYLEANPEKVPENVKVTVIPVMNPDGLKEKVGTAGRFSKADVPTSDDAPLGRFNANNVDLNRNFDCEWQADAVWQQQAVSGGDEAFSEPESKAIRGYINESDPVAVVVWYSAAGGVFASNCRNGVLPETALLTNIFADASGYKAFEEFDFYEVTGDMVNWLAKNNVPAISVLLTTHENVEWDKNKAGIEALLEHYAN